MHPDNIQLVEAFLKVLSDEKGKANTDTYFNLLEQLGFNEIDISFIKDEMVNLGLVESFGNTNYWVRLTTDGYKALEMGLVNFLNKDSDEYKLNMGSVGNNANIQIQIHSNYSTQTITTNSNEVLEFLTLLKNVLENFNLPLLEREDINEEIEIAEKQLAKAKDIESQLRNIGNWLGKTGANIIDELRHHQAFNVIKPYTNLNLAHNT